MNIKKQTQNRFHPKFTEIGEIETETETETENCLSTTVLSSKLNLKYGEQFL